jgi:NADPH:quinone reductase-like Zn-dependent oxidoreductase
MPRSNGMSTMNAVVIHRYGGPDELVLTQVPRPEPGRGEVLVKVAAAAINPVDFKTRGGSGVAGRLHGDPFPLILGWDAAGTVAALGDGVTGFAVGDEVYGLIRFPALGAAYAEYLTAPATDLAPQPSTLDATHAAAVPLAALTADQALFDVARVTGGQDVLITAGAGGVGHLAVQLAARAGARVTVTGSARNEAFARSLGAAEYKDYNTGGFDADGKAYDVIVDLVGSEQTKAQSYAAIRPGGIVVQIPAPPRDVPDGVRVVNHLVHPDGARLREISAIIDAGELRVEVAEVLPLAEAAEAHRRSESGRTRGKLVLSV